MQQLQAYALRAEFEGTVEVFPEQGAEPETVDRYQGGLLAVGDGSDFDVKAALARGDGTIVVRRSDSMLTSLLDAYPALKSVAVPEKPAAIVSPYARLNAEALRHQASLRDLDGAASAPKRAIVAALEAQDVHLATGDQAAANAVEVGDVPDGLDRLTRAQLDALAPEGLEVPSRATNADVVAALRERGITADPED